MKKVIITILAVAMIVTAAFAGLCACSGHTTTIEYMPEYAYSIR